ncbi:CPBP family intramembrane glutamic endopeptidase [Piscibacillus halophilus]|uniref:CPBP family intramembrane glutamic endopeptidase n=1 Tax=Piscibacillus halophilus TaxID=571933 RepID=UPI0015895336|nr:CPBP family intramembrane glutamic endopeptidase [Piscibacillus halophilus]
MKKQADIVKELSNRELLLNLYFSQLIFIVIAFILSIFLFEDFLDLLNLFDWDVNEIVLYGLLPGLFVVFIDIILMKFLPEHYYDDGGINHRIFTSLNIPHIFLLALVVSLSEELLFRGVIQTSFGWMIASIIFALVHFRYLNKIVLLVSVLLLSFLIGYMYEITQNLLVPVVAHFTIDFLLGIYYRLYRE